MFLPGATTSGWFTDAVIDPRLLLCAGLYRAAIRYNMSWLIPRDQDFGGQPWGSF